MEMYFVFLIFQLLKIPLCIILMIVSFIQGCMMFIYLIVPKPSIRLSSKEMCKEPDLTLQFINYNRFINVGPSYFRFWINLIRLSSLHILHSFVFIYLFMLSALILHKKILLDDSFSKMFEANRKSENKNNLVIRREKQEWLFRLETKLSGVYYTFVAFLTLIYCGFICSQILEIAALHNNNVYFVNLVMCKVCQKLKECLYFAFGFICILEIIFIFYLNQEILYLMSKYLARSYQLFHLKFKICMVLLIVIVILNFFYVMPFFSYSFVLLEVTYKEHSFLSELLYSIGLFASYFACINFICNLRFHLIYTNLENINELLVSKFCKFPKKYSATSAHFHSSKHKHKHKHEERKQSHDSPKFQNNSIYETDRENDENSAASFSYGKYSFINKDREEFTKLRELDKLRRTTEISLNVHLNENQESHCSLSPQLKVEEVKDN